MSDLNFGGRVAVITGAGGGLGKTYALDLASRGASIVVNDLGGASDGTGGGTSMADQTVKEINESGGKAAANYDSVATPEGGKAIIQTAIDNFGKVDIVINNAGNAGARMMQPRPFREMDPEQWAPPIDVNLHGVMNTTHAVLSGMCERRFGRLITISSGAGIVGLGIGVAPYAAGKGGAISFMRHMAIENASLGVTANSVALGLMEMTEVHDEALVAKLASTVPIGRLGTGDDLGPAIVWLASNEAAWVTGQTIQVNGGSVTS